jgi:hypothetical protein
MKSKEQTKCIQKQYENIFEAITDDKKVTTKMKREADRKLRHEEKL